MKATLPVTTGDSGEKVQFTDSTRSSITVGIWRERTNNSRMSVLDRSSGVCW